MPCDLAATGLSTDTIGKIQAVFRRHHNINSVWLYGSRAKGNYRHGSDIDLTIKAGEVSYTDLLALEAELDDLMLPYTIDLSVFKNIESKCLVEHIERVGVEFYGR